MLDKITDTTNSILIICPDQVRLQETRDLIIKKLKLSTSDRRLYYGDELKVDDIRKIKSDLYSTSLFEPKQIIEIKRVEALKPNIIDAILDTKLAQDHSNFLLLTASNLKSNSRLKNYFKKINGLIDIPALKNAELTSWTIKKGKDYQIQFNASEASLIAQIAEDSPDKIDQMLKQLSLYSEDPKLKKEDILELFFAHPEPNEFLLIEQALNNTLAAEKTLNELLLQGKNSFLLLNLIGKTLSKLLQINLLKDLGHSSHAIQSQLGLPPWLFSKQSKLAANFSIEKLKELIGTVITVDSRLKNKSLGEELILTELIRTINYKPHRARRSA